jgi:hypothetical protein
MNLVELSELNSFSSLDLIERIDELEDLGEEGRTSKEDQELLDLYEFSRIGDTYSYDWSYGAILVAEEYFEEYIRTQVEENSDVNFDIFPFIHMNWDDVADDARSNYEEMTLGEYVFWIES